MSALFGITPGALRVRAHRARRELRETLLSEWRERPQREEVTMMVMVMAVDVQDVVLWMPRDWKPKPPEGGAFYPETAPAKKCVVLLKEREGRRLLPIWIGPHEGDMLTLHLVGHQMLRPLTHDFVARLLESTQVVIERAVVSELRGDTFIATVTVRAGDRVREVDARPSDAINLAARVNAPLYVDDSVMAQAGIEGLDVPRELNEATLRYGGVVDEDHDWRSGRDVMTAMLKRE